MGRIENLIDVINSQQPGDDNNAFKETAIEWLRRSFPIVDEHGQNLIQYGDLQHTSDRTKIDEAVNSELLVENQYVARNKLITEEDCRILAGKLQNDGDLMIFLFNPLIPSDALHQLAIRKGCSPLILACIDKHPNVLDETKVISALCRNAPASNSADMVY